MKSVSEIDRLEACPDCQEPAVRQFVPSRVFFSGTSVQHAEWNPGLGCVVKNKEHRKELAKRKGLVEIGNDFKSGESAATHFDQERESKIAKRWEDV